MNSHSELKAASQPVGSQPVGNLPSTSGLLLFTQYMALAISVVMLLLAVVSGLGRPSPRASWSPGAGGNTETIDGAVEFSAATFADAKVTASVAGFSQSVSTSAAGIGSKFNDVALDRYAGDGRVAVQSDNTLPPEKRWQFVFDENLTLGAYAQQLDGLGIELAVIGKDGNLNYLSSVSQVDSVTRVGPMSAENRLYLTWSRGDLLSADQAFFTRAKIDMTDSIVLHFLKPETEQQLLKLESDYRNLKPEQILRTRFGIKLSNKGYELYVTGQNQREEKGK